MSVEPKLGPNAGFGDVQQTMETVCQDQPDIFYEAVRAQRARGPRARPHTPAQCDDIFEMQEQMINDFLAGMRGIDICNNAGLCYKDIL